jgi:serine/threonine protein kinase
MSYSHFPSRFGKYILLDRINSGGMAEVYRAKVTGAEKFQRLVAIKCMLPQLNEDQQFTTMFIDEAKLAAQLAHANIVQIYELGRINENLYIAMELVNGRDLRHIIKRVHARKKAMPVGFASYVLHKVAEGLDFAHRKIGVNGQPLNLVHRDVSPQNILVSYDGEVKVVDFGIAKAEVRDTETRAGVLKGKFAYMAPEQVMGGHTDRRADIFALGTVFYEVLTGKKLFQGESDFSILEKVRAAQVPQLSGNVPDVPAEVDAILKKALCREVGRRYAWASDLAEDLAPLLITNRTIFGAKQAKEFMQGLYADDIDLLSEQQRKYLVISEEDCAETSEQKRKPRSSQVFESSLDEKGDARSQAADEAGEAPARSAEQPTRLSDVKQMGGVKNTVPLSGFDRSEPQSMVPEHTGWTGVHTDKGFGADYSAATQLLQQGLHNATQQDLLAADTSRQPSLKPKPYEDSPSVPASGLRPTAAQVPRPSSSKGVLGALIAATLVTLAAIIAVVVYSKTGSGNSIVTAVPLNPITPTTSPGPISIIPTPVNPAPAPAPAPTTPTVGLDNGTEDDGDDGDDPTGAKRKGIKNKAPLTVKTGFVTVKAMGVQTARVFVNGKDAGYSPLLYYKVKIGKNSIRIVEEVEGQPGRAKTVDFTVAPTHTRKEPLKLVVPM